MRLNAVKVLEIWLTKQSKKEVLEYLRKYLSAPVKTDEKTLTITTPNTEQLVFAVHHPWFAQVLNQADLALPDAIGVVWASRLLTPEGLAGRIPGVEFLESLVAMASIQSVPTALIGGKLGVAVEALECLSKQHPGLTGWADTLPPIHIEEATGMLQMDGSTEQDFFDQLAVRIVSTGVQIVAIALGPPKQEVVMQRLRLEVAKLTKRPVVFLVVGGSLDEIAGRVPRAPAWVSGLGMKWLWRLVHEPWRAKRQLALIEFVFLVLRKRMGV